MTASLFPVGDKNTQGALGLSPWSAKKSPENHEQAHENVLFSHRV